MFKDAYAKAPEDVSLGAILEDIRTGRWRARVEAIRSTYAATLAETGDRKKAKAAVDAAKRKLPAFCVSGTAKTRKDPGQHSGVLQIDIDGLGDSLPAVREKLKADAYIAFGFVSPSGDGLKCGLRIDGNRHGDAFIAAQSYFRQRCGLEIDDKVKDRLRLCYVSYDPEAWTNPEAEPLPLPAGTVEPEPTNEVESARTAAPSIIVLPSGSVSISESARAIFERIGPSQTLFWRGGALVELVTVDGVAALDVVKPDAFRTRVEKFGNLFAWRTDGNGNPSLKPSKLALDDAKAMLAATEAREYLPAIGSVLRCPVITEAASGDVEILGRGYHPEQGGLLIVAGEPPPQVPVAEAAEALRWLLEEFRFQSEGDRSRAVADFITPALRIGGFLRCNVPVAVAEADKSQSGKGHRLEMVCTLYNESSYFVTARNGGVGGVDESFAAALIAGRPFICLDNFRGKLDSQHLEAFLTCPSLFPARIPHRGESLIDPKRFILQMTSNGLEATRDLANRANICRIRKRPGFAYRDTLGELQRRQPYFLGAVFSLVAEWIASGKPRSKDCRHDFREWNQTLDWIVRELVGCAPLMEGHEAAQERVSNPALCWLRAVALAVEAENRLGLPLIASELVEVSELHGLEIPGKPTNEDRAKRQVGMLAKQLFRDGDALDVDGFSVARDVRYQNRPEGGAVDVKTYTFSKAHQLHQLHQPLLTP
jgi:hypothetical protein